MNNIKVRRMTDYDSQRLTGWKFIERIKLSKNHNLYELLIRKDKIGIIFDIDHVIITDQYSEKLDFIFSNRNISKILIKFKELNFDDIEIERLRIEIEQEVINVL